MSAVGYPIHETRVSGPRCLSPLPGFFFEAVNRTLKVSCAAPLRSATPVRSIPQVESNGEFSAADLPTLRSIPDARAAMTHGLAGRTASVKGFRMPASHCARGCTEAGVRKASKEETAGEYAPAAVSVYGDLRRGSARLGRSRTELPA